MAAPVSKAASFLSSINVKIYIRVAWQCKRTEHSIVLMIEITYFQQVLVFGRIACHWARYVSPEFQTPYIQSVFTLNCYESVLWNRKLQYLRFDSPLAAVYSKLKNRSVFEKTSPYMFFFSIYRYVQLTKKEMFGNPSMMVKHKLQRFNSLSHRKYKRRN